MDKGCQSEMSNTTRLRDVCLDLLLSSGVVILPCLILIYTCYFSMRLFRAFGVSVRTFNVDVFWAACKEFLSALIDFDSTYVQCVRPQVLGGAILPVLCAVFVRVSFSVSVFVLVVVLTGLGVLLLVATFVLPIYFLLIYKFPRPFWSLSHSFPRDVSQCLYTRPRTLFQHVFGYFFLEDITHCEKVNELLCSLHT